VGLLRDDGRKVGVEEVGVGLVQDLAAGAVAVEVGDVDGKRVL
jgi:hypothetical protein